MKEARETIYWLRLLEATGQTTNSELTLLARKADEIARIVGAIFVHTNRRPEK